MKRIFMDLEMNTIDKAFKEIRQCCTQEVIEFGAICLDENLEETAEFQCYVKPEYNSGITPHITHLTGIRSCQVEDAESFEDALSRFLEWCGSDYEIYSWSDSDLNQLQKEMEIKMCSATNAVTQMFGSWKDLQKMYDELVFCERQISLKTALSNAGLEFKGRAHGALTDARAAADLFREMKTGTTLRKLRRTLESGREPLGVCLGDLLKGKFVFA